MKRFMIFLAGLISGYYLNRLLCSKPAAPREAEQTVYVMKAGSKYHRAGCQHLQKSQISMALKEAVKRYGPCSVCKPQAP